MPKIQEILKTLSRPIGLPKDIKATPEAMDKWKKEKKPNFINRSSCLKLGGIGAIILVAVIGIWALIKDSKAGKWISGIGGTLALGSLGADAFEGFSDDGTIHAPHDLHDLYDPFLEEEEEKTRRKNYDRMMGVSETDLNFGSGLGIKSPRLMGQQRDLSDPNYILDPDGNMPWL